MLGKREVRHFKNRLQHYVVKGLRSKAPESFYNVMLQPILKIDFKKGEPKYIAANSTILEADSKSIAISGAVLKLYKTQTTVFSGA